jgi:uncharacterized protein (DUF1697 family)
VTVQVALLRAVNVGAAGAVAMPALREVFLGLGARDARTHLTTGNVVFDLPGAGGPALERRIERALARQLGLATCVVVRTAAELVAAIDGNPFPAEAQRDPAHLVLVFLQEPPRPELVRAVATTLAGPEPVVVDGRTVYAVYPNGIARSRLTLARIESALGTKGTGRNWNTVRRLSEISGRPPGPRGRKGG